MKQKGIANPKIQQKIKFKHFIPTIIIVLIILFFFHSQIFNFFKPIDTNPANLEKTTIYTFPDKAVVGTPWKYNFSKELIPLLESMKTTNTTSELKNDMVKNNTNLSSGTMGSTSYVSYVIYLGPGSGPLPAGLTLSTNGVLEGTPTGNGGKFEICIKDNNEISICTIYQLNVGPIIDNNQSDMNVKPIDNNPPSTISSFLGNWKTSGPVKFYGLEMDYGSGNIERLLELYARELNVLIKNDGGRPILGGGYISADCWMDLESYGQVPDYDGWDTIVPPVPHPRGGGYYTCPIRFGFGDETVEVNESSIISNMNLGSWKQKVVLNLVKNNPKFDGKDTIYVDLTSTNSGYESDVGTIILIRQP